jgi:hypothetical protein
MRHGQAVVISYRSRIEDANAGIDAVEVVEEVAELIKPVGDELIRQAAQGSLFHNDDTLIGVLKLECPREMNVPACCVGDGIRWRCSSLRATFGRESWASGCRTGRRALPAAVQMCDASSPIRRRRSARV